LLIDAIKATIDRDKGNSVVKKKQIRISKTKFNNMSNFTDYYNREFSTKESDHKKEKKRRKPR
jgi:hypothetical protein